ncbi:MAG: hypothetical protein GY820_00595 [Gammaproteobacteria bacterium]|nr:hypothetical protein [Gammaproteobacteria bacterium]
MASSYRNDFSLQKILDMLNNTPSEHGVHQSIGYVLKGKVEKAKQAIVDTLVTLPDVRKILKRNNSSSDMLNFMDEEDYILNALLSHVYTYRITSNCTEVHCPKRRKTRRFSSPSITYVLTSQSAHFVLLYF